MNIEAPKIQVLSLDNKCPKCGHKLYTHWETPASDHNELGRWFVECSKCGYEHDDDFGDLERLQEVFKISDKGEKRVYVIGAGVGIGAIEVAKTVLELEEGVEIICVKTIEDVPLKERFELDSSVIQQIHKLNAPPIMPLIYFEKEEKRRGHERPYKYHK